MVAVEWDIFKMLPGDAPPEFLATLFEAREKRIRVELRGPGSGSFAINRWSPECTEENLAQGNLVKVRIPEIDDDYLFAFFLESGEFALVSSDEKGGEMLRFGGRGAFVYTHNAIAWSESFITGGQDPANGVWRAYAAGTGNKPGQILRRLIEEIQHVDRPSQPLPLLTIDFDYDVDSTAETWVDTPATDEFSYQVGEHADAIIKRLMDTNEIIVQMGPDLDLHAYNPTSYGRNLTGDAFGAGVVRFERGVNIATELRREVAIRNAPTTMLVGGETDHFAFTELDDAAERVTKEEFVASFGIGATALVGVGAAELAKLGRISDIIKFPIKNRRNADVHLAAPVSVGSVVGPAATQGAYLPGPEGTNGDFWLGDGVSLHTGSDPFDYNEATGIVQAITIARDDDNHELVVIPEIALAPPPPEPCPDDQTQHFGGTQQFDGFIWEISGIEPIPLDSASLNGQQMWYPYQWPDVTPGNGEKAMLLGGIIWSNELQAFSITAHQLTAIDRQDTDSSAPAVAVGHLDIASASGAYSPDFTTSPSPLDSGGFINKGWAACAAAFGAKPGETPTIVQTKYGTSFGGEMFITLDDAPIEGNVLVCFMSARNSPGNLAPFTAGWDGLAMIDTNAGPNPGMPGSGPGPVRFGRLLWKEVCP